MTVQFFHRMHYDSFFCLAFDSEKHRYFYNFGFPLYLEKIPTECLCDRLLTKEEQENMSLQVKKYGTKFINLNPIIQGVCHVIIHLYYIWFNKKHDEHWAKFDTGKYSKYTKWYRKIFSKRYFNEHQYQMGGIE